MWSFIGIFAINDPVRKNVPAIIKKLHQSGVRNCVMITGDDEGAAHNAAKITKIDNRHVEVEGVSTTVSPVTITASNGSISGTISVSVTGA